MTNVYIKFKKKKIIFSSKIFVYFHFLNFNFNKLFCSKKAFAIPVNHSILPVNSTLHMTQDNKHNRILLLTIVIVISKNGKMINFIKRKITLKRLCLKK